MENLGIDYKLLIAQVVNFGILFFVFRKYLATPFINYLKKERKKDEDKERLLLELETKHSRMLEEEERSRKQIKQEQEKVLAATKKSADKLKEELMAQAKGEAEALVANAKKQLAADRQEFNRESKKYITDMSILVIERALANYLTPEVQRALTEHVINNLPSKTKNS